MAATALISDNTIPVGSGSMRTSSTKAKGHAKASRAESHRLPGQ